jgi:mannose/fructose/N-acetylgalactosamine-specific phosphotransferase system component IIC
MVAKLTVIFFILLCFLLGLYLTLLPWFDIRMIGDWGDNYLLAYVAEKTGLPILKQAVSSNWFRGAVTGLGILNLFIAFWEIAHFSESVAKLEGKVQSKDEKKQELKEL